MATYAELFQIEQDAQLASPATQAEIDAVALFTRVRGALLERAVQVIDGELPAGERRTILTWAHNTTSVPDVETLRVLRYLLANSKNLSVAAILGADDTDVKTAVEVLFPLLAELR